MAFMLTDNRILDDNGRPLSGGKVYVYEAGTTTPIDSYPTAAAANAGTPVNSNPVILNAAGIARIYGKDDVVYKVVIKDRNDTTIETIDNISLNGGESAAAAAASATAAALAESQALSAAAAAAEAATAAQASANLATPEVVTHTANGTDYALPYAVSKNNTSVFVNGIYQRKSLYSIVDGATVRFLSAPSAGATVEIVIAATSTLASGDTSALNYSYGGEGAVTRGLNAKLTEVGATPGDFGAVGDGAADDTAKLAVILDRELFAVGGKWKTYSVTDTSVKGALREAMLLKDGAIEMPNITPQYFGNPFAAHYYGGQLKDLLNRICDPLCQSVGITFIGDSITWGVGATGSAPETPRDGTLSDPRDYYKTGSYVNLVKRHIKSMLGNDTSEALSNHPASSSGESIVTYTKTVKVFPSGGVFTVDLVGTATDTETMDDQTLLNARRVLAVAAGAGNTASLSFAFTGDTLEVVFGVHGTGARYNLYVDGVLIDADCGTRTGDDGMTLGYSRSRIHTFGRVVNKTVKIEVIPHEENAGASSMYLEALRIPKTIRIKNQGISGIKSTTFRTYNMPSSWDGVSPYPTDNSFGDGVALDTEDDFCFVQLGTNDRIASDAYIESPQTLYTKLAEIIDLMPHETNPILMVANPAENDEPPTYHCGMRDQANVISKLARDRNIDFIDNFTIFQGVPFYAFTADGLHPNDLGYKIMASNIIHAIENAK